MVEFASQNELDAFPGKWRSSVLATDRPKTVGIDANPTYLIRVQTETADFSRLTANLSGLNPNGASAITLSSDAAKRLIAIGADTAIGGKHVGINYLTTSDGFQDEQLAEAPPVAPAPINDPKHQIIDDGGTLVENWNPNPFNWVYMKAGGNFDTGVAPAWKVLERIGAFNHKIKIAVIDGGFGGGDDFPTPYEFNKASFAALIRAANPGLDNDGVERILYETAHQKGNSGQVERWPNAYAAVLRALGGTPPEINIRVETVPEFGGCQAKYHFTATVTDPDHGPPKVTWTSDITNTLGTGGSLTRSLPDGVDRITATAVDGMRPTLVYLLTV